MSGLLIAQIMIDDSSDKVITGVWTFDSSLGGSLAIPSGSSFPSTTHPGEIYWRTDQNIVYRRDDTNSFWVVMGAPPAGPAGGDLDDYYPNPTVKNISIPAVTGDLLYYDGYSWEKLPIGTDGYFLQVANSIPSWRNHDAIRKLIHLASDGPYEGFTSGAYREMLPAASPFPTSITWYTNSSKTNLIMEKLISYNSNKTPNTITWKAYDVDGFTLLATATDTFSYSGVFETSRTRTIV